ncbi:hypothetical protein [Caenispirillum bisanense]|uniref:Hemolysin-type calcium-binding repeat-containing protein n=1 Tax=Caenispirillum bisanense TaxID=414052 RepID=A0A286GT81_9PROT|nr:hypothetical protein [Caenispirillum bisanense]SOD98720.1 hypothetical protein SAMN05421508_10862 [Caenispirillum bisanense]
MSKPSFAGGGPSNGGPKKTASAVTEPTSPEGDDAPAPVPLWLPKGLRDGLPEHLGGGLPPGWGGSVPGLLNTKANRPSVDDGGDGSDGGAGSLPRFAVLDDGTLFDRAFYLEQNPDVAAAAVDPAQHFLLFGRDEGRDPFDPEAPPAPGDAGIVELEDGTLFDPAYYLLQNPDVAAAAMDPLAHYVEFGRLEGRAASSIDTPVEGTADDDLLQGDVADNLIHGGAGNDTLEGGAGIDLLNGGAGDDTLTGGEGVDVFSFDSGSGNDTVTDFVVGTDVLMIGAGYGFVDAAGVLTAAADTDVGVVITLAEGETVILQGVSLADLTAESLLLG